MAHGGLWNLFCGCCGTSKSEFPSDAVSREPPTSSPTISSEDVSIFSRRSSRRMSEGEEKQFFNDLLKVKSNTMPATPQMVSRSQLCTNEDELAPSKEDTSQQGSITSLEANLPSHKKLAAELECVVISAAAGKQSTTVSEQQSTTSETSDESISETKPDSYIDTVPVEQVTPRRILTAETLHQDSLDDENESHA